MVKCGKCAACLYEKSVRNMVKIINQQPYDWNNRYDVFFITLTYKNEFIPLVSKRDLEMAITFTKDRFWSRDQVAAICNNIPIYRCNDVRRVRVPSFCKGVIRYDYKTYENVWKEISNIPIYDFYDDFSGKTFYDETTAKENSEWFCDNRTMMCPLPNNECRLWINKEVSVIDPRFKDYVPVSCYSDVQDYFKRVRRNIKRFYNIDEDIKYWAISEYGETSLRPHFHVLAYVPKGHYYQWKRVLLTSWRFDDNRRRKVERAYRPAQYLSSYVNGTLSLPPLLQTCRAIKPNHSSSAFFGTALEDFAFDNIKSMFYKGDLTYTSLVVQGDALAQRVNLLPAYALSRFFPKFRGFSRFTPDQIHDVVARPQNIEKYLFWSPAYVHVSFPTDLFQALDYEEITDDGFYFDYTGFSTIETDEYWLQGSPSQTMPCLEWSKRELNVFVSFINAQYRKVQDKITRDEYAFIYSRIWSLYTANQLRVSYENDMPLTDEQYYSRFDRQKEVPVYSPDDPTFVFGREDKVYKPVLRPIKYIEPIFVSPNENPKEIAKTKEHIHKAFRLNKQRKFKNAVAQRMVNV